MIVDITGWLAAQVYHLATHLIFLRFYSFVGKMTTLMPMLERMGQNIT